MKEGVDASLEHLRPFMPWARFEPEPLDAKLDRVRAFRGAFDTDEDYIYGIFTRDETRYLGGTGFHQRGGAGSLEIGYWVRADATRQGIATESTAVLARVAIELCDAQRVDLQVDPENTASQGIPRKLGFTHEATLRRRLEPPTGSGPRRDSMLFTLLAEELPVSACPAYAYTAYDAAGSPVTS